MFGLAVELTGRRCRASPSLGRVISQDRRVMVVVVTLAVVPAGLLAALFGDQECNHLPSEVMVAEGPRAPWCNAVVSQWHWLWLLAGAVLTTLVVACAAGGRPWLYGLAWCAGAAVALVPVAYLSGLGAYPLA